MLVRKAISMGSSFLLSQRVCDRDVNEYSVQLYPTGRGKIIIKLNESCY